MTTLTRRAAILAGASMLATRRARPAPFSKAILYKNPGCECCDAYARYLGQSLISVEVITTTKLAEISRASGIPEDLEGCHLTSIGGYAVSGHVPIEAIRVLLAERPALSAITLPGMPSGSPGMPGDIAGPLIVYAISSDGSAPSEFKFQSRL